MSMVMSREIATKATNKIKQYNKEYYDQRHKVPSLDLDIM